MEPAPEPEPEPAADTKGLTKKPKRAAGPCSSRGATCCSSRGDAESVDIYAPVAALKASKRLTEDVHPDAVGLSAETELGWENNLPVIIVPGFLSSAMDVRTSYEMPTWENQRIWFSVQKLGGNLAHGGAAASSSKTDSIYVELHEGRNLIAADEGGTSDPYCRVTLLSSDKVKCSTDQMQSKCIPKTLDPQWDEEFTLGGTAAMAYVLLEVLDSDA